ncbi:hypothetical protein Ae717Ps2_7307c [Pseudonocardia sp. Ae717_Ps2]|nr:hypothetical protein Ae717Ps2_7307c [Pseudonocardia sp. Ae717_Ps2]
MPASCRAAARVRVRCVEAARNRETQFPRTFPDRGGAGLRPTHSIRWRSPARVPAWKVPRDRAQPGSSAGPCRRSWHVSDAAGRTIESAGPGWTAPDCRQSRPARGVAPALGSLPSSSGERRSTTGRAGQGGAFVLLAGSSPEQMRLEPGERASGGRPRRGRSVSHPHRRRRAARMHGEEGTAPEPPGKFPASNLPPPGTEQRDVRVRARRRKFLDGSRTRRPGSCAGSRRRRCQPD